MSQSASLQYLAKPFEPRDPAWEFKVRDLFARTKALALIGAEILHIAPGRCDLRLPFREDLTQQNGYFHAGITTTLVDSAAGYAGFSLMPPGSDVLAVEFKLNLLAPGDGDFLVAEGHVIKPGKNLVITRGEVYALKNTAGGQTITHCASMQQTLMTMVTTRTN